MEGGAGPGALNCLNGPGDDSTEGHSVGGGPLCLPEGDGGFCSWRRKSADRGWRYCEEQQEGDEKVGRGGEEGEQHWWSAGGPSGKRSVGYNFHGLGGIWGWIR